VTGQSSPTDLVFWSRCLPAPISQRRSRSCGTAWLVFKPDLDLECQRELRRGRHPSNSLRCFTLTEHARVARRRTCGKMSRRTWRRRVSGGVRDDAPYAVSSHTLFTAPVLVVEQISTESQPTLDRAPSHERGGDTTTTPTHGDVLIRAYADRAINSWTRQRTSKSQSSAICRWP
jgi:hypothetical protein